MNDTSVSLIIPTRSRLQLALNCVVSFFVLAKAPERVEAILVCDLDDFAMYNFAYFLRGQDNVKLMFRRQSDKIIRDYNNWGAKAASGKYVWILNDDVEMVTADWDQVLESKIDKFLENKPDRIVYAAINDDTHVTGTGIPDLGCCFPVLSREAVAAQGGIMPEEIDVWGADIAEWRIFSGIHSRVLNLIEDVKITHYCPHNGSRPPDNISLRCKGLSKKSSLTETEVKSYRDRLGNLIRVDDAAKARIPVM